MQRWRAERAQQAEREDADLRRYTPPDPYRLTELRAAEATSPDTFERQWQTARQRALDAEHARRDSASPSLRLTAAELSPWTPPGPYAAGIKALQEETKR
jgi:hypothetical protein